jgi:hypothetical protein
VSVPGRRRGTARCGVPSHLKVANASEITRPPRSLYNPPPRHSVGRIHGRQDGPGRDAFEGELAGMMEPSAWRSCVCERVFFDTPHSGLFKRLADRLGFQGYSIHAVALPSRLGPVVEHVAEMTATAPAMHFCSWNDQAVIVRGADGFIDRRRKARPASAAVELGFGAKEREIAGRAREHTGAMLVIECAGIRPLRPALPQYLELFGGQYLLPFRFRL